MTRTFIALEMNDALQRHLAGVIRQVAQHLPGIRWVDVTGIHLTLAFLGELDDAQLACAIQATKTAAHHAPPFSYQLTRPGIFGSPRHPRVIWMGIAEPSGILQRIHRTLNWELQQQGFEVDTRPFSPHLTLARVKSPLSEQEQQQLQALLAGKLSGITTSDSYAVHHLDVMKSELARSSARYTLLLACPLHITSR